MLRLAAGEAAQKQRWPRPGNYSSTVTLMLRDGIGYEEFRRRGEVGLCEGSGELRGNTSVSEGLRARPAIFE
jgi:hypothetical protein